MNTSVYFGKRNKLNKMISLALFACKVHRSKWRVRHHMCEALRYMRNAKMFLKRGLYTLYNISLRSAQRWVACASFELKLAKLEF